MINHITTRPRFKTLSLRSRNCLYGSTTPESFSTTPFRAISSTEVLFNMANSRFANPVCTHPQICHIYVNLQYICTRCTDCVFKSPLGFGCFATTLMTLSLSLMGFRGVSNQPVFIGNLCFLAGLGLLISAQWEMVKENAFSYTVLAAFGKLHISLAH